MNNYVQVFDVTLRDGGYKTNFYFPVETIKNILTGLDQSGIPYIEVGYRNGSFKPTPDAGVAVTCPDSYLRYCKTWIKLAKLAVMVHPRNIQLNDLIEMRECGVDCLRICFPMQDSILGFKTIELALMQGFDVFTNITRISQYSRKQVKELVSALSQYNLKAIYLADSNGSLTPEKLSETFAFLRENCQTPFGFHAHDNLFLAQANALAAIKQNVQYIDSSLFGIGKGSGNLRTEGIISFLKAEGSTQYDLCKVLEAAEYVKNNFSQITNNFSAKDIVLGLFNLSQDDAAKFNECFNVQDFYANAQQYSENLKCIN